MMTGSLASIERTTVRSEGEARPEPITRRTRRRTYSVALGVTLVAVGSRLLLEPVLDGRALFALAFPAVMIAALWGGLGPALLSTALNAIAVTAIMVVDRLPLVPSVVGMGVFLATGAIVGPRSQGPERAVARAATATAAERRAAHDAAALKERLQLIIDSAPALISYVDRDLRYRIVNRGYERWFHRSPHQVEGRHVREVVGAAGWERTRPYMERALAGETVRYEDALPNAEGGTRWVELVYTPDRDADGQVLGFVALAHDVSERKRGELALMQNIELSERKRILVTALSEMLTPEQVASVVIEHALPMTGARAGTLVLVSEDGKSLDVIATEGYGPEVDAAWTHTPLDAPVPMAEAARLGRAIYVPSAEEATRDYPEMARALSDQTVGATAALPLQVAGRTIGVLVLSWGEDRALAEEDCALLLSIVGHCANALERARLYDAEQRAREQAEAANRAKDEFLAMLGHELRNPLAPIVTAIELMKLRGDRTSERERVVIERQASHLVQLVDDLLDVSRIARGKLEIKHVPVEVHEAVARAIEIASPLLEQRRHRLVVEVPTAGLRVFGDPTRLAQIFANLLTNAAKYTDPGGEVRVTATREAGQVVTRVRDSGVGIAPELLPHVFDLFVQGPRGVDRRKGGLGLGLAIVKSLTDLHRGTVSVKSEGRGLGTEIAVALPLLADAAEQPAEDLSSHSGTRSRSARVLVVDDNVDAAEMLGELLLREGYDTRIAHDGPSALALLPKFHPDVAVLDLGLPVMDGYELAHNVGRVSSESGRPPPRLVALTGYGQPSDRERTRAAGFAVHLVKPVDLGELLRAIEPAREAVARAE